MSAASADSAAAPAASATTPATPAGATAPATPTKRPAGRGRNLELPDHLKTYKGVWVFIEHDRGHVHSVSWELLGEARKLADTLGSSVGVVALGGSDEPLEQFAAQAFAYGADKAYLIHDPVLKGYRNAPFTRGLTDLVNKYQPEILLLGATSMGRDLAGSVATTLLTGLTADCTALNIDPASRALAATRPTFGGSLLCTIMTLAYRPQMATVRPRVMAMPQAMPRATPQAMPQPTPRAMPQATPDTDTDTNANTNTNLDPQAGRAGETGEIGGIGETSGIGEIVQETLGMAEDSIVTKLLDFIPDAVSNQINLPYADVIVSGGKGLKHPENFNLVFELARVLGGEVGATRPCVQAGWVEAERQVGQTGKTVRPRLYIAAGISGAIQHRVGMESADVIVAINSDPNAPIFEFAHYGIVGNAMQVLPALTAAFAEHLGKRRRLAA